MGTIKKVTIEEMVFNTKTQDRELQINEYTREDYQGDFDFLVLENTHRWDVQNYAEGELDMIDEDDCDCSSSVDDHADFEIISYLEEQGYQVVKCQTITDTMKFEKIKQLMEV